MGLLDIYPFVNLRRNHGLEHATIHILSQRNPTLTIVGRSDMRGFILYGTIEMSEITLAVHEALQRLQQGQNGLAIHPHCGTILATTGILTGLAAFAAIGITGSPRQRFRWGSIPEAVLAATLAAIIAQPLGMIVQQKITVSGNPGQLEIGPIIRLPHPTIVIHRIYTRQ